MCKHTDAKCSAVARRLVGGSPIERKVAGPTPRAVILPAEKQGQKALVECDDGRNRWFWPNNLPVELRAAALVTS